MTFLQVLITSLFAFLFTRAVGSVTAPNVGTAAGSSRRRMVRCSSCGVYVLEDRALRLRGGTFACSTACRNGR